MLQKLKVCDDLAAGNNGAQALPVVSTQLEFGNSCQDGARAVVNRRQGGRFGALEVWRFEGLEGLDWTLSLWRLVSLPRIAFPGACDWPSSVSTGVLPNSVG